MSATPALRATSVRRPLLAACALAALALATPPPVAAAPNFAAAFTTYPVGTAPFGAAVADLDRDGKLDVVTANRAGNSISVLRGLGDGTFAPHVELASPHQPNYVAIGDVNGDGWPDLVVSNFSTAASPTNSVSVFLNLGAGVFAPPADYATGSFPGQIALADLNRDGKLDVVVLDTGAFSFSVLLGHGDGTFAPHNDVALATYPTALAVGDLNGDGVPDLAISQGSSVAVLVGNGNGTFTTHTLVAAAAPVAVQMADMNRDGKPDVVVTTGSSDIVSVYPGHGDGTFGTRLDMNVGVQPGTLAVPDIDGDGTPDLVFFFGTPSPNQRGIAVCRGHSDGTFDAPVFYAAAVVSGMLVPADLNGDGHLDLVSTNFNTNTAMVILGNPDGTLGQGRAFGVGPNPYNMVVADVNGDGKPDVVTTTSDSTVSVLLGHGDGTFGTPVFTHVPTYNWTFPGGLFVADLDRDGRPDLFTLYDVDTTYGQSILFGNGDGTFGPRGEQFLNITWGLLAIADMNHDGILDLVTTSGVMLGQGDGTFDPMLGPFPGGDLFATSGAIGDVNGDDIPDLVAHQLASPDSIVVLPGRGDGTFASRLSFAVSGATTALALCDLNGDGRLDLVTSLSIGNSADAVQVQLGNGDGTFGPQVGYDDMPRFSNAVAIADVDGDGKPDIVLADALYKTLQVLYGVGDGTFRSRTGFGAPGITSNSQFDIYNLALADVNGDGRPDIVTTLALSSQVAVLLNNTPTLPTAVEVSLVASSAQPGLVQLTWFVPTPGFAATLERRTGSAPWTALADVHADGSGDVSYADHAVVAGQGYAYRLALPGGGHTPETSVTVPAAARFALAGPRPNPARGPLLVALSLPNAAPAKLELLDVSGRRVAAQNLVGAGPGELQVRLAPATPLRAGLYFVRLTQGGRSLTARASIVR